MAKGTAAPTAKQKRRRKLVAPRLYEVEPDDPLLLKHERRRGQRDQTTGRWLVTPSEMDDRALDQAIQRVWHHDKGVVQRYAAQRAEKQQKKMARNRRKGGAARAEQRRRSNAERDRRIHDAASKGTAQKAIALDERLSPSQVSRILSKPRPPV